MGHYFFTLPLAAFVVSWWAARRWPSSRVLWAGFLGELVVLGVLRASVRLVSTTSCRLFLRCPSAPSPLAPVSSLV